MERKCKHCKEKIIFDSDNIDQVIRYDKACYHYDCFIDLCQSRMKKSNVSPKWGMALDSLQSIQDETKEFFADILDSPKDKLYRFLLATYNTTTIPSYVFQRLQEIYDGKYKGASRAIPPEDLLDMWTQKQKTGYLEKIRARNVVLGKDMEPHEKIMYDLAVLLGKYDDYLRWKAQQHIIEQDVPNAHDILKTVDLDRLSTMTQNQKKADEDDIDALLDELFD